MFCPFIYCVTYCVSNSDEKSKNIFFLLYIALHIVVQAMMKIKKINITHHKYSYTQCFVLFYIALHIAYQTMMKNRKTYFRN